MFDPIDMLYCGVGRIPAGKPPLMLSVSFNHTELMVIQLNALSHTMAYFFDKFQK